MCHSRFDGLAGVDVGFTVGTGVGVAVGPGVGVAAGPGVGVDEVDCPTVTDVAVTEVEQLPDPTTVAVSPSAGVGPLNVVPEFV